MTILEVRDLNVQPAVGGRYVLDITQPIKIVDVAQRLNVESRFRVRSEVTDLSRKPASIGAHQ